MAEHVLFIKTFFSRREHVRIHLSHVRVMCSAVVSLKAHQHHLVMLLLLPLLLLLLLVAAVRIAVIAHRSVPISWPSAVSSSAFLQPLPLARLTQPRVVMLSAVLNLFLPALAPLPRNLRTGSSGRTVAPLVMPRLDAAPDTR